MHWPPHSVPSARRAGSHADRKVVPSEDGEGRFIGFAVSKVEHHSRRISLSQQDHRAPFIVSPRHEFGHAVSAHGREAERPCCRRGAPDRAPERGKPTWSHAAIVKRHGHALPLQHGAGESLGDGHQNCCDPGRSAAPSLPKGRRRRHHALEPVLSRHSSPRQGYEPPQDAPAPRADQRNGDASPLRESIQHAERRRGYVRPPKLRDDRRDRSVDVEREEHPGIGPGAGLFEDRSNPRSGIRLK
jgi:hypothetical protein